MSREPVTTTPSAPSQPTAQAAELLHMSVGPHLRHSDTVAGTMLSVAAALVPALVASVAFFGIKSAVLVAASVASCVLTEWLILWLLIKRPRAIADCSAVATGLLLAFTLPPGLPVWMAVLASVFAVGVVKMPFGGLGGNFLNPAMAGRVFLMVCYPAALHAFVSPASGSMCGLPPETLDLLAGKIDGVAGATPLAAFNMITTALSSPEMLDEQNFHIMDFQDALVPMFLGRTGGCIGETSALALIVGAAFLWYRRVIGFKIPATYLTTMLVLSWLFNGTGSLVTTEAFIVPVYHILGGGVLLGALFMATDPVTSPVTPFGKILFGTGCGVLTFLFRKVGGHVEGVAYAIVLMNLTVPLINRFTCPRAYGTRRRRAKGVLA